MSGSSEHKKGREETGPIQRVEWTLISAMPYPMTGETVNIGIVYRDAQGRRRLAKGPYRKRLEAFAPEPAIQRTIEAELQQLERNLEQCGEIEETRHIVKTRKTTLRHRKNRSWVTTLLEQMVPNYAGNGS